MDERKVAYGKRAKILARKRELLQKRGLRLTGFQKLMLLFKFVALMLWYPIGIWLPDKDEPDA
jgi:hypothetical protein